MSTNSKRVVIIGGGFGGLRAAKALKRAPVQVTLVDRTNHHLFQPLLYQVATAGLTAQEIATPIRSVLRDQANTEVMLGEVHEVNLEERRVLLADGAQLAYDYLVVAAGAETNYHGNNAWQKHAFGLKTMDDAFRIRHRVLMAFEAAERESNAELRARLLTFVVIGGGPTGVEMAGAINELSREILARDFRQIDGSMLRVVLVEMGQRVLAPFVPSLSENARQVLTKQGVDVRTNIKVKDITEQGVLLDSGFVPTAMICWAAGVQPQPLATRMGVALTRRGQIAVENDCSIPGHPEAFVIGDMAAFTPEGAEQPLPGLAPVAMQQGTAVAANILRSLHDQARVPFKYLDKGVMATIGSGKAVLQFGKVRMTGFFAWVAWLAVHVFYIIGFRNRAMVMSEWGWAYLTRGRGSRVVTQSGSNLQGLLQNPRAVVTQMSQMSQVSQESQVSQKG